MSKIGFSGNCFPKQNLWTESTSPWTALAPSTVDRRPLPLSGPRRSSGSGRSGAQELRLRGGREDGRAGELNGGLLRLGRRWKGVSPVAEALTRKGDGEGMVRVRREGVGGVGGFAEGGVGFYGAEVRPSVFNGRR
jgi:hypothetical protein